MSWKDIDPKIRARFEQPEPIVKVEKPPSQKAEALEMALQLFRDGKSTKEVRGTLGENFTLSPGQVTAILTTARRQLGIHRPLTGHARRANRRRVNIESHRLTAGQGGKMRIYGAER